MEKVEINNESILEFVSPVSGVVTSVAEHWLEQHDQNTENIFANGPLIRVRNEFGTEIKVGDEIDGRKIKSLSKCYLIEFEN